MSITLSWRDSQKRIIVLEYPAAWDWEHFGQAVDGLFEVVSGVEHKVAIIHDMSRVVDCPVEGFLPHFRRLVLSVRDSARVMVGIGCPEQMQMLCELVSKAFNLPIVQAESEQEALKLAAQALGPDAPPDEFLLGGRAQNDESMTLPS